MFHGQGRQLLKRLMGFADQVPLASRRASELEEPDAQVVPSGDPPATRNSLAPQGRKQPLDAALRQSDTVDNLCGS